jgi:large conductance mechanosensitive channel
MKRIDAMLGEFKRFALKGNVVDMAVGVVIGGAFGKIVSSFLNDVLMPPLGMLTGGVNFSDHKLVLKAASGGAKAVTVDYGSFLTVVLDFVIVAFAMFMVVKGMNALRPEEPPAPPSERPCPQCLMSVPAKATRCGHCSQPIPA